MRRAFRIKKKQQAGGGGDGKRGRGGFLHQKPGPSGQPVSPIQFLCLSSLFLFHPNRIRRHCFFFHLSFFRTHFTFTRCPARLLCVPEPLATCVLPAASCHWPLREQSHGRARRQPRPLAAAGPAPLRTWRTEDMERRWMRPPYMHRTRAHAISGEVDRALFPRPPRQNGPNSGAAEGFWMCSPSV